MNFGPHKKALGQDYKTPEIFGPKFKNGSRAKTEKSHFLETDELSLL